MTDLAELRRQLVARAAYGDGMARACLGVLDRLDAMTEGAPECPVSAAEGSGWCVVAEAAGRGWAEARSEAAQAAVRADGCEASMRLSELSRERALIARADALRDAEESRALLRQAHEFLLDVAHSTGVLGAGDRDRAQGLAAQVAQHLVDHTPGAAAARPSG